MLDAGAEPGDANSVVGLGDLSLRSLIGLVDRLRRTETPGQFLCREIELDEAYVQADADLRRAESEAAGAAALEQARQIRALVIRAHDLVGESDLTAAVQELNKVIEMKIGL